MISDFSLCDLSTGFVTRVTR